MEIGELSSQCVNDLEEGVSELIGFKPKWVD